MSIDKSESPIIWVPCECKNKNAGGVCNDCGGLHKVPIPRRNGGVRT